MKYLKYTIAILLIIIPCALAILIYNDKLTQNAPRYYKQGTEYYEKGDFANAFYNYSKINKISPLRNIAIYKQAKSAQKAGDYKTAALKYKLFLEKDPKSIFAKTAKRNYAKSCYYAKQFDEAQSLFDELIDEEESVEALYYAGLTAKQLGNKENTVKYLSRYLMKVVSEGNSVSDAYMLPAAEQLAELGLVKNGEIIKLMGIAYYKNKRYDKALTWFSKLPLRACWDWYVLANHYAGKKVTAKQLVDEGLKEYAKTASHDNLREIYNIYMSYLPGSRLKNRTYMYETVKNNELPCEDYMLYKMAEILPADKAVGYYSKIVEKYPQSDYAPESLWNVFFAKYKAGNYAGAEADALKHIRTYKTAKSAPKMLYWAAKTFLKENKMSEAHACISRLISKFPDSYYGLRGASLSEKNPAFWDTVPGNKIDEKGDLPPFPLSVSDMDLKNLKVINTIFEAGDYEIWLDADFENPIVESWFERKKNKKAHSVLIARDALEKSETKPLYSSTAYQLAYPWHWISEINKLSGKYGLDAYFVTALIREESYFNPKARSAVNATGLMQLMPDTANYVITKLQTSNNSDWNLEVPEINLYLGCTYLKYLKDKFGNDVFVTAAYNGGEGAVLKWIKQYGTEDIDVFIESIPVDETRNYIKKVFRSYHLYNKIYK